jgi:hypothetical protein
MGVCKISALSSALKSRSVLRSTAGDLEIQRLCKSIIMFPA